MSKQKTEKSLHRRAFLKGAGLTGVAAAGVAAASLTGGKAEAALPKTGKQAGYRETEHVMKFYELSRF